MKRPITFLSLAILLLLVSKAYSQVGYAVSKDYRIAKFEKDIILYLKKRNQVIDIKSPFNIDDYKFKIIVWKGLQLYSQDTSKNLLLIGFSTSADHGDKYWGILNNDEKYFFYNTNDSDFKFFRKKYSADIVEIITLYCKQHVQVVD